MLSDSFQIGFPWHVCSSWLPELFNMWKSGRIYRNQGYSADMRENLHKSGRIPGNPR